MHAASRHETPSLTSLPKDGKVSWFVAHLEVAHPVSGRTQPCLTLVKLMGLAGPLGHSPHRLTGKRVACFTCGFYKDKCYENIKAQIY